MLVVVVVLVVGVVGVSGVVGVRILPRRRPHRLVPRLGQRVVRHGSVVRIGSVWFGTVLLHWKSRVGIGFPKRTGPPTSGIPCAAD